LDEQETTNFPPVVVRFGSVVTNCATNYKMV